jgi:hypothetical protein
MERRQASMRDIEEDLQTFGWGSDSLGHRQHVVSHQEAERVGRGTVGCVASFGVCRF